MKKINYVFLLMFLSSFAILSGCKKDDEEETASKSTLIATQTGKQWKVTAAVASSALIGDVDLLTETTYKILSDCNKDDVLIFYTDKTYQVNGKTNKCVTGEPDVTSNGTWVLSSDEKQITLTQISGGSIFPSGKPITLTEVTATTLKGEYADSYSGFPYTAKVTFTAQ